MNFVDEQSGERLHKRHKFVRRQLSRKTSPESNLADMMVDALTWSDPKLSYHAHHIRSQCTESKDAEFKKTMELYYANRVDDSSKMDTNFNESDSDLDYDELYSGNLDEMTDDSDND